MTTEERDALVIEALSEPVDQVVDLICRLSPPAKKGLLAAVGQAMIRAEVERQAVARARAKAKAEFGKKPVENQTS